MYRPPFTNPAPPTPAMTTGTETPGSVTPAGLTDAGPTPIPEPVARNASNPPSGMKGEGVVTLADGPVTLGFGPLVMVEDDTVTPATPGTPGEAPGTGIVCGGKG